MNKELGSLSEKYEVGNRGAGTVSTGTGDAGGVSYGSYQMTSKPHGGTVTMFVSQENFPFKNKFKDLIAGSPQFTQTWNYISQHYLKEFEKLQYDYIKESHYNHCVKRIKDDFGLDINSRSRALQNVVWSTAVQHGPENVIIHTVLDNLQGLDKSNEDYDSILIKSIYAERGRKDDDGQLANFTRNSLSVQQGVANRFINEERDALKMLEEEKTS